MDDQRIDSAGGNGVIRDTKQPWYKFDVGEAARQLLMPFIRRFRFSLKSLLIAVTVIVFIASAYWTGYDRGYRLGDTNGYANGVTARSTVWQDTLKQRDRSHKEEIANLNKSHGLTVERYSRSQRHMEEQLRVAWEAAVASGAAIKITSPPPAVGK